MSAPVGVRADARHRPTALELHSGVLVGEGVGPVASEPAWTRWAPEPEVPRAILERDLLELLRSGPCAVQFSGGRDSSLVLAVAAHVARREGLPLPRAVTVRYRGVPDADESSWQRLVVDHVGVPLEVIDVEPGGDDLAGAFAVSRLLRDGAMLPAPAGVTLGRIGPAVPGHTVLTGEGGDVVLGMERISYWIAHWRRRRFPSPAMAAYLAADLLPAPVRRRRVTRRLLRDGTVGWLRPDAQRVVAAAVAREQSGGPWDWRRSTWSYLRHRQAEVVYPAMDRVAAAEGFSLAHPLLAPGFVESICRFAGGAGLTTRTAAMRLLASDLLPEALLTRTTKATFNTVYTGDATRAFARAWDGSGVDDQLVDVEALRAAWLAPEVHSAAAGPLQLALVAALASGWAPSETERV